MRVKDLSPSEKITFIDIVNRAVHSGMTSGQTYDALNQKMGYEFAIRTIQRWMTKEREAMDQPPKGAKPKIKDGTVTIKGTGSETAEVDYWTSKRIRTLDEALEKAEVDLTRWDVDRWEVTSWEVGAKDASKKVNVHPLWRVSVKLKAKKGWNPSEFREILMRDLRAIAPTYELPEYQAGDPQLLMELSIFDAHFGKLAWGCETTQDYDLNITRNRYMTAANDLLDRAKVRQPSRILYVVGNDFYHVDHKGLTTNGTPMDTDGRWQKAFRLGKDCAIETIEKATQIAPVDVMVVPGNHDREKAFTLGEVLDARFHANHSVVVFNDPDIYSYYRWGKVLLGFVHGDNHSSQKKRSELPVQMATDCAVDWSETVWREWHLGHFHSEQEDVWKYRTVEHVRDVAVRVLPSLSSTDAWHREQGYASVLAAEAHYYHKRLGRYSYDVHQAESN